MTITWKPIDENVSYIARSKEEIRCVCEALACIILENIYPICSIGILKYPGWTTQACSNDTYILKPTAIWSPYIFYASSESET